PFTAKDVFLHRASILTAILEKELAPAVEAVAGQFLPASEVGIRPSASESEPNGPDEDVMVTQYVGRARVRDTAAGKGSHIRVTALFRSDDSGDGAERVETNVKADLKGEVIRFAGVVNRPLRDLAGWQFEFVNPGLFVHDVRVVLEEVNV